MTQTVEMQPWMPSPWVETYENYDDELEDVANLTQIAWFDVRMDMADTDEEKKEQEVAKQEQIRMGILQPNGFPVGMASPPGMTLGGVNRGFNFPGAIGIPIPTKFNSTPVTKHLLAAATRGSTPTVGLPGVLPGLGIPNKGQDRSVFKQGDDKLKRIQELTKDRRR